MKELTQKELKLNLHYNPLTGIFTRLSNSNKITHVASNGYIIINIFKIKYKAHRLAFLYMEGVMPINHVDHDNRIRHDNKWKNLKHATPGTNAKNRSLSNVNKSGCRGVSWDKDKNKWNVKIGKQKIGQYTSLIKAIKVRLNEEIERGYTPLTY